MPPITQFGALADTTRCRIIELLLAEPVPVHRLTQAFAISRPAISRHLRVLRDAGLVRERRRGRENVYELQLGALDGVRAWLAAIPEAKPVPPKVVVAKQAAVKPVAAKPVAATQMAFDL